MYEGQGQMDPETMRRMMMAQALMQGQGSGVPQGVPGGAPMMGGGMAPGGVPMGVPGGAPMAGMAPAVMPPAGGGMAMPEREMGRPRQRGGAGRLFGGAGGFQNRYE